MTDELLPYFEEELARIRRSASEFGKTYPAAAGHLHFEAQRSRDPHVERLIEAFAYIAGRVHRRLDAEYPELTDALLGLLYPDALAPIPSCAIVAVDADPQLLRIKEGLPIPAGTQLTTAQRLGSVACTFTTTYPMRLWPLTVAQATARGLTAVDNAAIPDAVKMARPDVRTVVALTLRTASNEPLLEYSIPSLRFHLTDHTEAAYTLYDLLLRDPVGVLIRAGNKTTFLPPSTIKPVGFDPAEGLLPDGHAALLGYRLLTEYFALPEKFLFVEFTGLRAALLEVLGPTTSAFEILVLLEEQAPTLERHLRPACVRLGCTPAINLFAKGASPIRCDQRRVEYRVTPDAQLPGFFEVHTITRVQATRPGTQEIREFRPFFSIRHAEGRGQEVASYHVRRSRAEDGGTEVDLMLVDPAMRPLAPGRYDVLDVTVRCSNRDIAASITAGTDFLIQGLPQVRSVVALGRPTKTLRPHLASESRWRLVSHLGANYLTLSGSGADANAAFREVLTLFDFADTPDTRTRIAGLVDLATERVIRIFPDIGPVRGLRVELTFDRTRFVGGSAFLFASVLEAFLSQYVTINSFVAVEAKFAGDKEPFKRWTPKAGQKPLL